MENIRIIAEIGINHDGSAEKARALIQAAANAGVWGIKFQYRNLSNAYADGDRQIGDEILIKEIFRNYLNPSEIVTLSKYAHSLGIKVGISFFSVLDTQDFFQDIGVFDFFKIPSVEFTNIELIEHISQFGKVSLISTGAFDQDNIEQVLKKLDKALWTPLHCISNYPVSIASPKLGYIKHLKGTWGSSVGYSSHDEYWETCLIAMNMGASIIERHITFDKSGKGLDHSSSSTPEEFLSLVQFSRNHRQIIAGDGPRTPNQGERLNLQNLGRSYYAKEDIAEGVKICADQLVLRSPRIGLGEEEVLTYFGQTAIRSVKRGGVIERTVFETPKEISQSVIEFARSRSLSLPVRFHDFDKLESRFPIGRFEFHLSFGDLEQMVDLKSISRKNKYSIHLPDYINPTQLFDLFSPQKDQSQASCKALDRTTKFAKSLEDWTGEEVPIICSFSEVHTTLRDFYQQHVDLISRYGKMGITILPQWLPPTAWYFGGSAQLNAMNNLSDIKEIKNHDLSICMDICHLCMGEEVFNFQGVDVICELGTHIRHLHLAEASGFDGEGLAFGQGDDRNRSILAEAMDLKCTKVIEVWQGHLNSGSGFASALEYLNRQFND